MGLLICEFDKIETLKDQLVSKATDLILKGCKEKVTALNLKGLTLNINGLLIDGDLIVREGATHKIMDLHTNNCYNISDLTLSSLCHVADKLTPNL
jgi:hypothetical protein